MNEEEKEAIERLKHHMEFAKEFPSECFDKEIKIALNYIDKLQKEIKELKEELQYYKDNIIEDLENRDRWE